MGTAGPGACLAFGELAVAVGFDPADLRPVILHGRGVLAEIGKGSLAVAQQGFRQDQPALGLGEDASVLLGTGIENDGKGPVKGMGPVGRIHQDGAVLRIQPAIYILHGLFRLLRIRQAADHRPALGIEPEIGLRCCALADDLAVLRETADEAVLIPAQSDQLRVQGLLLFFQPGQIVCILLFGSELTQYRKGIVELEGHERGFSVGPQPQAVVPVGIEAGRHAVRSQMLQGEVQRPLQVVINTGFVFIREGDHLIQEGHISGLRHVFVDSREEPEGVIRPIGRMPCLLDIGGVFRRILMARVMGEFDQGQAAAVMDLGREHEPDLVRGRLRFQMDHALDILDRIPVAVPVPESAVNKGSGP